MSILKRAMDLAGCAAGLALSAPVLLGAALAVWFSMGRPILFLQRRPGLHGESFEIIKFRTMRAQHQGDERPEADAARLTLVGRILRATSVDELPTLWSVLKGDMSLVGPRPLLVKYLDRYSPEQARRHEIKPGITGLAQVNGRNTLTWEEKFALDVWYVDHQSMVLDIKILAKTVLRVLRQEGVSASGYATMPEFMGSEEPPRLEETDG